MIEIKQTLIEREGRSITLLDCGIRVVVQGDSEWWMKYVIVPRQLMIDAIRRRRANGYSYHDCDWWELIPLLFRSAGYGGPGRWFADTPCRYRQNRRWVVFYQKGWLDV